MKEVFKYPFSVVLLLSLVVFLLQVFHQISTDTAVICCLLNLIWQQLAYLNGRRKP